MQNRNLRRVLANGRLVRVEFFAFRLTLALVLLHRADPFRHLRAKGFTHRRIRRSYVFPNLRPASFALVPNPVVARSADAVTFVRFSIRVTDAWLGRALL